MGMSKFFIERPILANVTSSLLTPTAFSSVK